MNLNFSHFTRDTKFTDITHKIIVQFILIRFKQQNSQCND